MVATCELIEETSCVNQREVYEKELFLYIRDVDAPIRFIDLRERGSKSFVAQ
jgi:hypothetical protein